MNLRKRLRTRGEPGPPEPTVPGTSLREILRGIEGGTFPSPDLSVTVVSAPSQRDTCVIGLTGHIVLAADVTREWAYGLLASGDPSAPLNPPFLSALEKHTGRRVNAIDALLLASAITNPSERTELTAELIELTAVDHPRVRRARRHRDDVRVYGHPAGGLVLTGVGVAGRLECAVEVPEALRGKGHGRRLSRTASALAPAGSHIWAQVTPGNAASLRAFLAAGYVPVGSEALLVAPHA